MIESQELIKTFLPEWIDWNRYEIIKINDIKDDSLSPFTWRVEFIIEEKNIVPSWLIKQWEQVLSKWFYPLKKIHDFPVRSKIWTLIIKKRRWIKKETNEYISNGLEINYPWTLTTKELMNFLK